MKFYFYQPFLVLSIFTLLLGHGCKEKPCKDVVCENNGTCNDGVCECEFGYSGTLCENELFGSSLTVDSIEILSYPDPSSSTLWDAQFDSLDPQSNPDVFFRIFTFYHNPGTIGTSTQRDWTDNYNGIDENAVYSNLAMADLPVTIPINVTVTGIRTIYEWEFQIEDYEGVLATYMAEAIVTLVPYVNASGSSSVLIEDGDFNIRVYYSVVK